MENLTPRQKIILIRTVESYITTVLPVGSRALTERCHLALSPASVRHEMGVLENRGYLSHPHTSAGRVPTDKGYQFYVREGVDEEPISDSFMKEISRELEGERENLENLLERASRILSTIAEEAVLVLSPTVQQLYLKKLTLVPLDEKRLLAVWCSTSGWVQDCLVWMPAPCSPEEVDQIRNFVNEELAGVAVHELEEELLKRIRARQDSLRHLYERTLQIVQESLRRLESPRILVEGSHFVLDQPEFQHVEKFRMLVAALEDKPNLLEFLRQGAQEDKIRVAIGEKELSKKIWDCSLVSLPYRWRGQVAGVLGVLGPRRMRYGRMMGLVRQMTKEVSRVLDTWGT